MSESKNSTLKSSFRNERNIPSCVEPRPDILSKLKCIKCEEYLSCTPIYLTKDGEAICGRCSPGDNVYRNTTFEKLAEMISFPCSNQRHGCRSTIPFLDRHHETACEYRQYMCPLISTSNCDWLGPGYKLLEHCSSEHDDVVLTNPCILKHDISKDSLNNFLILAFEMLFLIHTKVCTQQKKIYHSIRLIGDPQKANMFNFNLDIENRGVLMNKQGVVVEQGCVTIQERYCTSIGFKTLQEFLGDFEGTIFKIKLNKLTANTNCFNCHALVQIPADNNNKIVYCTPCIKTQITCENINCTYTDIRTKTEKHRRYFCPKTNRCLICKQNINIPLQQHYLNENIHVVYRAGSIWQAQRENNLQWCVMKSLVGILVCAYRGVGSTFKFYVCSVLISNQLSDYQCLLVLTNPVSGCSVTKQMEIKHDEIFDWKVQISDHEFLDVVDNDCFYVTIEICIAENNSE